MEQETHGSFNDGQYALLERIATGAPLNEVLIAIVRFIEAQADDMLCTILRVDAESGRVHTAAAPSVPVEYARAIDGLTIGPNAGSCGRAAYLKELVICEDIEHDQYWADYRQLALPHGLRACWSTPILSPSRDVLGTFAMYYRTTRGPTVHEKEWVNVGTHLAAIAIAYDVTRHLESQAQQAERMHALGTLAGGIAHDFNNILGAIRGHADLALMEPMTNAAVHESLQEINRASRRAAELVRRILTFSRHEAPRRDLIAIGDVVDEAVKLLRPTLPRNVEIKSSVVGDVPSVLADPTEIHQVVMNLVTNAAHAMREFGGTIEFVIDSFEHAGHHGKHINDLASGSYARIRVHDQGTGMDDSTIARVFEPFFTTKPPGEGTGLGLAVVYGIVKSHGGNIHVDSKTGAGTTFTLCFPAAPRTGRPLKTTPRSVTRAHNRHIMYVDDDEVLVRLAARLLQRYGYRVTGHSDPARALEDFRARPGEFDAIVTDMSMPVLSGADLAARIRDVRDQIPIVLVSAYVSHVEAEKARSLGLDEVVPKPQTIHEFAEMLRDRLDTPRFVETPRQLLT
jgi:signal transduction histidine kinase/ActR/RegA family two-component response regulator